MPKPGPVQPLRLLSCVGGGEASYVACWAGASCGNVFDLGAVVFFTGLSEPPHYCVLFFFKIVC